MGYEDPAPLAGRIAEAASELRALVEYGQSYLDIPDEFQIQLSAVLAQHAEFLEDVIHQILEAAKTARNPPYSIGLNLPDTDSIVGRYYVAGMPVWWIRHYAQLGRAPSFADYRPAPAEAEIVIYLDKYDDRQIKAIQAAATKLGEELGYTDFILTDEQIGSIFRRLRGKIGAGVSSDFVQQKMQELDARASIEISGRARAETDAIKTSNAVSLIASIADIPNAVVRVGGLLIVKQTNVNGVPAVMTRELSMREIRALELNPGIQKDPQVVLQLLAVAVAQLEEDERD
jgi:hypothetical protein